MTITFEVSPELEEKANTVAAQHGQDTQTYLRELVNTTLTEKLGEVAPGSPAKPVTAAYLLSLPAHERKKILEAQAEMAAPLYEADLLLPVEQRELTAFTSLDGEPILEN